MWTVWTTAVTFAIALGQFFFKGVSWDRYAIVILNLGLMGLLVLLYGPRTLRASAPAGLDPQHEGEEAARQGKAGAPKRLEEFRGGHSWCRTMF